MPVGTVLEFGPFRLDPRVRVLLRDGNVVTLTPKVVDTLVALLERRGEVVSKEDLMKVVWPDTFVEEGSLAQNLSVLRKALADGGGESEYIETIPKRGYRFVAPVREVRPRGRSRRWVWGVAAAVVAASAVGLWRWRLDRATPPGMRLTPLTSFQGIEVFPTFSPDGRQVAFLWNGPDQGAWDLYVKTLGAEPPRRLTQDSEAECYPVWSPDGRWIAFAHCLSGPFPPPTQLRLEVLVMAAEGGPKRRLGDVRRPGNPPPSLLSWTADSRALVIEDEEGPHGPASLVLLRTSDGRRDWLTTAPASSGGDHSPAVSPDGRTAAFVRSATWAVRDIYLLAVGPNYRPAGEPRRLTYHNEHVGNPMWSRDGREVLYLIEQGAERSLWRAPVSGGKPRAVNTVGEPGDHLVLSRQGDQLAYTDLRLDDDICRLDLEAEGRVARLIESTRQDGSPQPSPDGRRIAFVSARSGIYQVWVADSDGSHPTQWTQLGAEAGMPRWSPDSRRLSVDARVEGNADIYVIDAPLAKPRRLTAHPAADSIPSWSRDGRWIYFASKRSGRFQIWKAPAEGGDAVQVTQQGGFGGFESPDGRHFYYARTESFPASLWRVAAGGGPEEEVLPALQGWQAFAVVDDGICFVPRRGSAGMDMVEFYGFADQRIRSLAPIRPRMGFGFAVSRDRRWGFISCVEYKGGDLMRIEGFR